MIEVFTWHDLIQYGIANGGNIVNGLPWSFKINNVTITHDNQLGYHRYLIPTKNGIDILEMKENDVLIISKDKMFPCDNKLFTGMCDIFNYIPVPKWWHEETKNIQIGDRNGY